MERKYEFNYSWGKHELVDKLREEGHYSVASKIERGECLSDWDQMWAEEAADSKNMSAPYDYRRTECDCDNFGCDDNE